MPAGLTEAWNGPAFRASEGVGPCQHLDFAFLSENKLLLF